MRRAEQGRQKRRQGPADEQREGAGYDDRNQVEGERGENGHAPAQPQELSDQDEREGAEDHAQACDQQPACVSVGPAIGDVSGAVSANAIEAPLCEAELAVEAIDQVQAEAHHGHGDRLVEEALVERGEDGEIAELKEKCGLHDAEGQKDGEGFLPERLVIQAPQKPEDPGDQGRHFYYRCEKVPQFHGRPPTPFRPLARRRYPWAGRAER